MYTTKSNSTYSKAGLIVTLSIVFLLVAGVAGYAWWKQQSTENKTVQEAPVSSPQAGVIATLGQDKQFVRGENTSQPATQTKPFEEPPQQFSELPYKLSLPAGWEKTGSKSIASPCGTGIKWQADTYNNGSKTLVVYEDGNLPACGKKKIADVNTSFRFTEDGTGIKIADSGELKQCSKEENPECPKGDGLVSTYTSSIADGVSARNQLNGRSYSFYATDTNIEPNLAEQVRKLNDLIENISFQ